MTRQPDVFAISSFMRVYLVIELLAPIALMGILLWAISNPNLELSETGPLILLVLLAWAIWELIKLVKWFGFRVEVGDEGLTARGRTWAWDEIRSARAKTALKFDTFIELSDEQGGSLAIPTAIQNEGILLTLIEKHVPALVREG